METFYCIFLCKKEIDSGSKSGRKTERALGPAEVCFSIFVPFVHWCQNRFGTTSHNHTHKKINSSNGWHDHSLRIQPSPGLQSPGRRLYEVPADDAELSAHLQISKIYLTNMLVDGHHCSDTVYCSLIVHKTINCYRQSDQNRQRLCLLLLLRTSRLQCDQ